MRFRRAANRKYMRMHSCCAGHQSTVTATAADAHYHTIHQTHTILRKLVGTPLLVHGLPTPAPAPHLVAEPPIVTQWHQRGTMPTSPFVRKRKREPREPVPAPHLVAEPPIVTQREEVPSPDRHPGEVRRVRDLLSLEAAEGVGPALVERGCGQGGEQLRVRNTGRGGGRRGHQDPSCPCVSPRPCPCPCPRP